MLVYEDNFGFWDIHAAEDEAFYNYIRQQGVIRACERCERPVRLVATKTVCATCVSALEYGAPASIKEYASSQKAILDSRHPPQRSLHT
jgi:hypothetical protein